MGVLRPVRMAKVGLLGLKEDRPAILTALHDLHLAQVEPVSPEVLLELAPERGTEVQRTVAEQALRFRGLKAALPAPPPGTPRRFESLSEVLALAATVPIDDEVGALRREDDQLQSRERTIEETLALLRSVSFYPDRLELLRGAHFQSLLAEIGPKVPAERRRAFLEAAGGHLIEGPREGKVTRLLLTLRPERAEATVRAAGAAGIRLTNLPDLVGTVPEAIAALEAERTAAQARRRAIAERLAAIGGQWSATVAAIDEALQVEARLFDVFPKLASGPSAFALEAWVPERDVAGLRSVLDAVAGGRTFVYDLHTDEEPPTMMDNPAGFRWFEFFIRFYSLPKATEWDPTLVFAIVFPIFFGFMIGDWGYGLAILAVSGWMIAGFPGGGKLPAGIRDFVRTIMGPKSLQQLAKTLVPGALVAIALGLYFDAFFGVAILGPLFGYAAPVRPATNVPQLLVLAGFIGLGMVSLGFLFGSLKEFFHHHPRGGIGKAGGIAFAVGITFFGLAVLRHSTTPYEDSPFFWITVVGAILLVGGEGLQNGLLGLIEVVSHILSYTRLVGILLASVILAVLINTAATGYFHQSNYVAGLGLLIVGQLFNLVLAVFEPSIQGMRLMFVEYFSKFYEGDGKEFHPFGGPRVHTTPFAYPEAAGPAPPAGATVAR
jgi:V/A-type H+/Na+-transporting ATPase subunit I